MQALQTRIASAPQSNWPGQPIPIALVITELDVGGAEKILVELATRIDRRRWAPVVLALGPEAPLAAPLRAASIPVRCLAVNSRQPIRSVLRLAAALREHRPALVQSFLFHANVASRLAAPLAGRPWVVGGVRVAEHEKKWHLTLERQTQTLGTGSVCVSEGVRGWMVKKAGIHSNRLTVIPNGIDTDRELSIPISRSELTTRPTGPVALFVGRLTHQKGVDLLLEAAREVLATRPDWSLAIVGEGPDRQKLEAQVAEDGRLAASVRFLGQRGDVAALMRAADVVVLPSRWEGMPNVVLEAMALGKAVVATAVEGSVDLVRAGETGWLVPPENPATLASALLESAADHERNLQFGQAGRLVVEREFSLDGMARRYEALWARVLGLETGGPHRN